MDFQEQALNADAWQGLLGASEFDTVQIIIPEPRLEASPPAGARLPCVCMRDPHVCMRSLDRRVEHMGMPLPQLGL
jgi:hypothetical protein